ncbi:relaxase/mobilization nuclease domain-containing protein, partial [Glutamicibacter ardleyensis]
LEKAYGLETAPRRREQAKQPVLLERENARFKAQLVAAQRAQKEREAQEAAEKAAQRAKWRDASFPNPPTTRRPPKENVPVAHPYTPPPPGREAGYER